jgi:hypothetical protein
MRVSRDALPLSDVLNEEKVSLYPHYQQVYTSETWICVHTYSRVDDVLVAGIVVDVDCDAAEGRDFGGELVEAGVILSGGNVSVLGR